MQVPKYVVRNVAEADSATPEHLSTKWTVTIKPVDGKQVAQ